jgi:coatomer subunit epsilon
MDDLFDARNNFYLGNFQNCIKFLQSIKTKSSEIQLEKDVIMYRTYIAQRKYGVVLDEVNYAAACPELKSVRLLAEYFADPSNRERVVKRVDELISGNLDVNNSVSLVLSGIVYLHENNYETALKVLHNSDAMECFYLTVQILLQIHRPDLAKKTLQRMQDINEDHTLSQLALALYDLTVGGEKLTEAQQIYQELAEKYQASPMLLNGQATALMGMSRWQDAEVLLQEAMDKDPNNADTLVNMIVVSSHVDKPAEVGNRYMSQLKDSHRSHPFVVDYLAKEAEFTRLCQGYGPSVPS